METIQAYRNQKNGTNVKQHKIEREDKNMAANVETMFWTGRTAPWHGLGTGVAEAPTSKDALS